METNKKCDYENLIPNWVHFSIAELDELHIIKKNMAIKLFKTGILEKKMIGNKKHVTRTELIRYLKNDNNTKGERDKEIKK